MADGEVRAQDLAQETAGTLSGNEQFVMFDSTAGKRADIDDVATYIAGDKTTLKTTNKTSPVAAINENFDAIADVKEDFNYKVNQPLDEHNQPTDGINGQLLRTKGTGATEWVDEGLPTDEQTAEAVTAWLDEHPEATTTVQDGSLTEAKFTNWLKLQTIKDYVTPQMFGAVGDGVTDDTDSFNLALGDMNDGQVLYVPSGDYLLSDTLTINKNIKIYSDGTLKVTHSKPVVILDSLVDAIIDIYKIEKSSRIYDYSEGAYNYSIGVLIKNCDGCNINVHNIINTTTAFVLLGINNNGCHYNKISCSNAHTFTGVELIRSNSGGWVNGNIIDGFRWMVNTWRDNTNLVSSYMIKSLSYAKSGESEPYKNNGNMFQGLSAEYGAASADYKIGLVRLNYARGYTFYFDRVEILAKSSGLYDDFFYFTNSTFCIATIWFIINSFNENIDSTDHNHVYTKENYESLKKTGIKPLSTQMQLNTKVSYTQYWFTAVLLPAIKTVKLLGELIISDDINSLEALISNLPKGRAGYGGMVIAMGTTAGQWSAATNVTFHKLCFGGQNVTDIEPVGAIPSGTRLFVDIEYLVDDSVINAIG